MLIWQPIESIFVLALYHHLQRCMVRDEWIQWLEKIAAGKNCHYHTEFYTKKYRSEL